MNKLELAQLAPYLPYNLRGISEAPGEKKHRMLLTSFQLSRLDSIDSYGRFPGKRMQFFKPILRPLTDLTESVVNDFCTDLHIEYEIYEFRERRISYSMLSFNAISLLFSSHFDVFGLIDQGLAISYQEAGI